MLSMSVLVGGRELSVGTSRRTPCSTLKRSLIVGVHGVVRPVELRVEALPETQADRVRIRISRLERVETRERVRALRVASEQIVDLVELIMRADAQPMTRADRNRVVIGDLEDVLIERIALRVRLGARDERAGDAGVDRNRRVVRIGRTDVANGRVAEEQLVVRAVVPVREELRDRRVLLVVEAVR